MHNRQPNFHEELVGLFEDAKKLCAELIDFPPDIIVASIESGWYLANAAKVLWEASSLPFPPVIRANLGSDKVELFERLNTPLRGIQKSILLLNCRMYEFLSWLTDQLEWQKYLESQVVGTLGENPLPERILIVGSNLGGMHYSTTQQNPDTISIVGLLDILFPQARVRTFHGRSDYQKAFTTAWLNQFYPRIVDDLFAELYYRFTEARSSPIDTTVSSFFSIACGVERGPAESIAWQPLSLDSPIIHTWKKYLPIEAWLELPDWLNETLPREMLHLAGHLDANRQPFRPPLSEFEEVGSALVQKYENLLAPFLEMWEKQQQIFNEQPRTSKFFDQNIPLTYRIMRDAYHDGRVTVTNVSSRYHVGKREAKKHIEYCLLRNELYAQGKGRGKYYTVSPENTFILDHSIRKEACPKDEIEIISEKLWLGTLADGMPYPEDLWHYKEHIYHLRENGFTWLIKPSVQPDTDMDYDNEMRELLELYSPSMRFHEYDLEGSFFEVMEGWTPAYEKVLQIVNQLEDLIDQNEKVYVSMNDFGSLILDCLIARRKGSVQKGFNYLKKCRSRSVYYWRSGLADARDRAYVIRWMAWCSQGKAIS